MTKIKYSYKVDIEPWIFDEVERRGFEWPLTMEECPALLRMSRKTLQSILLDHPHFHKKGNRKLFGPEDVQKIWDGLAAQPKVPKPKRPLEGLSREDGFELVMDVATGKAPKTALHDPVKYMRRKRKREQDRTRP